MITLVANNTIDLEKSPKVIWLREPCGRVFNFRRVIQYAQTALQGQGKCNNFGSPSSCDRLKVILLSRFLAKVITVSVNPIFDD